MLRVVDFGVARGEKPPLGSCQCVRTVRSSVHLLRHQVQVPNQGWNPNDSSVEPLLSGVGFYASAMEKPKDQNNKSYTSTLQFEVKIYFNDRHNGSLSKILSNARLSVWQSIGHSSDDRGRFIKELIVWAPYSLSDYMTDYKGMLTLWDLMGRIKGHDAMKDRLGMCSIEFGYAKQY